MKKTYKIFELNGYAYECAIKNVLSVINKNLNTNYTFAEDSERAENIAFVLETVFDENGEILFK